MDAKLARLARVWAFLGAGLLAGIGLVLSTRLLSLESVLPADPSRQILRVASHYRGQVVLLGGCFAVIGVGTILATTALEDRFRAAGNVLLSLSARLGVAAGVFWCLRPLFWSTVSWVWALRFAGDLDPAPRKELLALLLPLCKQIDNFLSWAAWLALAGSLGAAGMAFRCSTDPWRRIAWVQLSPALALVWALPFHFLVYTPQRFTAAGDAAAAFLTELLLWETTAAALFATGVAIGYPDDPLVEEARDD